MIRSALAGLLLLAITACAYTQPLQSASTFYVMRHLNTPEGASDPDLTADGQRNAERLAAWFANRAPPATILVSSTRRAQQTAAPLAAKLGVTPMVYDPGNTGALVTEALKAPPPVLIVGHSNTVPDIVQQLGGQRPGPLVHADFGDVWTIRGRSTQRERIGG